MKSSAPGAQQHMIDDGGLYMYLGSGSYLHIGPGSVHFDI